VKALTRHYKLLFNPKPTHSFRGYLRELRSQASSHSPVSIYGHCDKDYMEVKRRFAMNWQEYDEVGASVTIYVNGKKVVDLWGGWADPKTRAPWEENTLVNVFSSGKSVECLCIAKLVSEGKLDYNTPVAKYWPEFAQAGKEGITVGQLMRHEAGLLDVDDPRYDSLDFILASQHDENKGREFTEMLARQEPRWRAASGEHGYHALSRGFYVSELIKQVDEKKRSINAYFNEEIATPLGGTDFYFVLPSDHIDRVARLVGRPMLWGTLESLNPLLFDRNFWAKPFYLSMLNKNSDSYRAFMKPSELNAVRHLSNYDSPRVQALEASSCAGSASARGLAKIHNVIAMGGSLFDENEDEGEDDEDEGGEQPGDEKEVERYRRKVKRNRLVLKVCNRKQLEEETKDVPRTLDRVLRYPCAFSRGGWLLPEMKHPKRPILGCGFGGSLVFADLENKISFAYTPNMMGEMDPRQPWLDKRATKLVDTLYSIIEVKRRIHYE